MTRLLPLAATLLATPAGCHTAPTAGEAARLPVPEPSDGLRESGPARYARTHPDFDWVAHDTAQFRLYAERGPGVESRLGALGEAAEAAVAQARAYVERRSVTGRVSLFFVDSRARMGDLLGRTPGGAALTKEDVAFFVAPPDGHPPALDHELAHLEAWEAFGERPLGEPWLDEGLATAAGGRCAAYALDEAGAAVVREGRAVPLAELAASFDVSDAAAYLQAGSVVAWVRERWGRDAVATLWRGGLTGAERATGLGPEAPDAAWRTHGAGGDVGVGAVLDWDAIRCEGCEGPSGP